MRGWVWCKGCTCGFTQLAVDVHSSPFQAFWLSNPLLLLQEHTDCNVGLQPVGLKRAVTRAYSVIVYLSALPVLTL